MNHNNVTTPLVAQGATDVQCRRNVRAMLVGPDYREHLVEVVDTGRRRTRWMPAITGSKSMSYDVAIVEVPGHREPWEIAVERLEPVALGARARWLEMAGVSRPVVQREEPKTPADVRERRRIRKRARLRQAGADATFAAPVIGTPAPTVEPEPRKRPSARAQRRERGIR